MASQSTEVPENPKAGTGARSDGLSWSAKIIVLAGGPMIALAFGAILPVLPQIERALSHGPSDSFLIKQLIGVVGLSVVIGAPLAGFLIDRIGVRTIVMVGCAVLCIAGTAGLYVSNIPVLVGSRLLVGAAAAAIDTTSVAIVNTRLEGNERAKWNGLHIALAMLTAIVLQPIVGYIAELSWRAPFALYALALPIGVLGAFGLDGQRPRERTATAAGKAKAVPFLDWFPFRYAVLALIIGIITYLPTIYGPFLMTERGASTPAAISFVLMGVSAIGGGMSMLYGRVLRDLSINATFVVALTLAAVGMLIASVASGFTGVTIGLLVFGFGLGWFFPNIMTGLAECVAQDQQGRAVGLVRTMHDLAAPLCLVLVEPLAKRFGPVSAVMTSFSLACALIAFFALEMMLRKRVAAE